MTFTYPKDRVKLKAHGQRIPISLLKRAFREIEVRVQELDARGPSRADETTTEAIVNILPGELRPAATAPRSLRIQLTVTPRRRSLEHS